MITKKIVAATILLLFVSTPCAFAETTLAPVPNAVLPDRRFHSGLLDEAELRRRLGINTSVQTGNKTTDSNN